MKIGIFGVKPWEIEYLKKQLKSQQDLDIVYFDLSLNKDKLPAQKDFEIISIFVNSRIDKNIIDYFPLLKMISTRSTGFDHIDLKYCKEKNIKVTSVPTYGDNTVAEFTFALLLDLSRKIYESYDKLRNRGDWSLESLRGFDLKDKTIGVIGTGHIGLNSIKIANGFGMKVLAYDAFPDEELQVKNNFLYRSLDYLLKESDVIILHIPYLPSTHHLIDKTKIALMKNNAVLINTSRGPVIDTEALLEAVKNEKIAGAGLDVLEEENITKDEFSFLLKGEAGKVNLKTVLANHLLIDLPNVIITPHNAFNTKEAIQRILDTTVLNIKGFAQGEPKNLVSFTEGVV